MARLLELLESQRPTRTDDVTPGLHRGLARRGSPRVAEGRSRGDHTWRALRRQARRSLDHLCGGGEALGAARRDASSRPSTPGRPAVNRPLGSALALLPGANSGRAAAMTSCERPPQGHQVVGQIPRGWSQPLADLRPPAGRRSIRRGGHEETPAGRARGARRRPRDARRVRDARPGHRPTRSRWHRRHGSTTRISTTATSRLSSAASSLRDLKAERIARWQAERLAAGAGPVAVRQALDLLGTLLQRAVEGERIATNPVRLVRRAPRPRREEVRPLAPATVEAMRSAASHRDATLLSVLAYAGLRPSEALALHWSDVRAQTILVQRALSLGEDADTKTHQHRTVRLLAPLRDDLERWRRSAPGNTLVFPGHDGDAWSLPAYQSGAAGHSAAPSKPQASSTRRRTRSGTRSPRCSCTRGAA